MKLFFVETNQGRFRAGFVVVLHHCLLLYLEDALDGFGAGEVGVALDGKARRRLEIETMADNFLC